MGGVEIIGNPTKFISNIEDGIVGFFETSGYFFEKNPLDPTLCLALGTLKLGQTWTMAVFEALYVISKSIYKGVTI